MIAKNMFQAPRRTVSSVFRAYRFTQILRVARLLLAPVARFAALINDVVPGTTALALLVLSK